MYIASSYQINISIFSRSRKYSSEETLLKKMDDENITHNIASPSRRQNAISVNDEDLRRNRPQGKIKVYDNGSPVIIKSPANVKVTKLGGNTKNKSENRKRNSQVKEPFTLDGCVKSTPKTTERNNEDDFEELLGKKMEYHDSEKLQALSPGADHIIVNSSISPSKSYRFVHPTQSNYNFDSVGKSPSLNSDILKMFKAHEQENAILLQRLEEREQEIKALLEAQTEKNNSSSSSKKSRQKECIPEYTIPVDDKPEEEEVKSNMPDYENMSSEEIEIYEAKFICKFQELLQRYPNWDFKTPKIGSVSLKAVHECYNEYVNTLIIYQSAMKMKVILVLAFAAFEYYFYKQRGIRAFKDFTKTQVKSLNRYHPYLLNFAKSLNESGGGKMSNSFKFASDIVTNIVSFAGIQGIANSFGWSAPESLLYEANVFFCPSDSEVRLKPDGIRPVPEKPSGWQDPNTIIERGSKLWNSIESVSNINNPETANGGRSGAKPVPTSKYEDVFE